MRTIHELHQSVEADIDHSTETALLPLHHQWPQLGQELFVLEQTLTDLRGGRQQPLTNQEKKEKREEIRNAIIAQLYRDEGEHSRDVRYLAFLLVKQARGGEIVGNPSAIGKGGGKQELPYTGLEGYYAGSERMAERPGMTREEIIQEEAKIGTERDSQRRRDVPSSNSLAPTPAHVQRYGTPHAGWELPASLGQASRSTRLLFDGRSGG